MREGCLRSAGNRDLLLEGILSRQTLALPQLEQASGPSLFYQKAHVLQSAAAAA